MKSVLVALLLLAPWAADAASPEEGGYLAAREAVIARFTAYEAADNYSDAVFAEHDRALGDLEAQLRPIIGPVAIDGFSPEGVINLDTLFEGDEGFAMLDGLVHTSTDDKAHVLVTTVGLLRAWLEARRTRSPPSTDVPVGVDKALRSESFYTFAISTDSAVTRFAEIPIARPKASSAYAMLAQRSQDVALGVPDEMMIAIVEGDRVYVAWAAVNTVIAAIPACDSVWKDYEARAEEASLAYEKSVPQDERLFDDFLRLRDEGDVAYHQCFADRASGEAFYLPLTKQAQALVDRLP
jgi:hypothetical protein